MAAKVYHAFYGHGSVFIRADWDTTEDPIQWSRDGERWQWLGATATTSSLPPRDAMAAAVGLLAAEQVSESVRGTRQVPREEFWSFLRELQRRESL